MTTSPSQTPLSTTATTISHSNATPTPASTIARVLSTISSASKEINTILETDGIEPRRLPYTEPVINAYTEVKASADALSHEINNAEENVPREDEARSEADDESWKQPQPFYDGPGLFGLKEDKEDGVHGVCDDVHFIRIGEEVHIIRDDDYSDGDDVHVHGAGDDVAVPNLKSEGKFGTFCNKCMSDKSHGIVGSQFFYCCNNFVCAACMQAVQMESKFCGRDDVSCPLCKNEKSISDSKELEYRKDPSSWKLDEIVLTNEHAHVERAKLWFHSYDLHDKGVEALKDLADNHRNVEAVIFLAKDSIEDSRDIPEFNRRIHQIDKNVVEHRKYLLQAKKKLGELELWDTVLYEERVAEEALDIPTEEALDIPIEVSDETIKREAERMRYKARANLDASGIEKYQAAELALALGAKAGNVECFEKLKELGTPLSFIKQFGVLDSNALFHNIFPYKNKTM